ncbi:hypothetical protein PVK06_025479 [Gossypium arboreum]|uniref:Aminotransferase-like plant mobile domain-containing protein n=1 Tax=Gossypium arboreum TaxID=29729 RepID=A0ABR0PGK6_GOSAR|nr:hypothetical protein PVK06_025479 [Gossypium arboreum]
MRQGKNVPYKMRFKVTWRREGENTSHKITTVDFLTVGDQRLVDQQFFFSNDEDWFIDTYVHILSARVPRVIEQHLGEAEFLHVSRMLGGAKLEPTLISALLQRWRPEAHTFHPPYGEFKITLKDMTL